MAHHMDSIDRFLDFSDIQCEEKSAPLSLKRTPDISGRSIERETSQPKCKKEKFVNVNVKITRSQKDWLGNTAQQIRDNNFEPVQPADRVYPQHLIQVAIAYLKQANVDWSQVKTVEELRSILDL